MPNILKRLLDLLSPQDSHSTQNQPNGLTNKLIANELVVHFTERLEEESFGQRMIYPMSFNILMHPDDFEDRKASLPFVLPEVVKQFYEVMKSKQTTYSEALPSMSPDWHFQFAACEVLPNDFFGSDNASSPASVQKGSLTITATLTSQKLGGGGVSVEPNIKASLRTTNSLVGGNMNINWEALTKIEILADGVYSEKFDNSVFQNTNQPQNPKGNVPSAPQPNNALGELSYVVDGQTFRYSITNEIVEITSKNDPRSGSNLFKIPGDKIGNPHVQIKYDRSASKFTIAAFKHTRVNCKLLEVSTSNDLRTYELPANSDMLLGEEMNVSFKRF